MLKCSLEIFMGWTLCNYVNPRDRGITSVISSWSDCHHRFLGGGGGEALGTLLCICQSKGKHLLFFKSKKELCAHFCHVFMSVTYIIPNLGHLKC